MACSLSCCKIPSPSSHCAIRSHNSKKSAKNSSKASDRLLSSLALSSSSDDPSATSRIIRKFVASSSKSAALQTLSLFLSQSDAISLLIYRSISTTHWFKWTPKLIAELISVLESNARSREARELISESVSKLSSQKDIAHFYCDLIDAASDRMLKDFILECYGWVTEMGFAGKRPFESMVRGLSSVGLPCDAEKVLDEMLHLGFRPSGFDYRMVIQGYGRLGSFGEMGRVVGKMEDAGLGVDTVCANVVLSCYGDYGRLSEMVAWIGKMRDLGIVFSVRTFNSVLNSCPTVVLMVKDLGTLPLTLDGLLKKMNDDEVRLVQELASLSVLGENMRWSNSEWELDLHGFHLPSAYVILLQWMEVLRARFEMKEEVVVPLTISVVCGSGKHSIVRGESPIKKLVSKLITQLNSPMRVDRKNIGKFVANGKAMRDWIC